MSRVLPYLRKMAKGGDAEAISCLRKMAEEGDDDAADALNEINPDGNGAGPEEPIDKSEWAAGDLFDLGELNKAIADAEPFTKSDAAGGLPRAENTLMDQPEVAAAVQMDAGDFVKSLVGGVAEQLDRVGDTLLWSATGVEALAKGQIAQGEILHIMAREIGALRKSNEALANLLNTRGAGVQGQDRPGQRPSQQRPAQPLNKAFNQPGQQPGQGQQPSEKETLRKSLRTMRDAETDPSSPRAAKIRAALDDLTINNLEPARAIVAAGGAA